MLGFHAISESPISTIEITTLFLHKNVKGIYSRKKIDWFNPDKTIKSVDELKALDDLKQHNDTMILLSEIFIRYLI